MYRFFLGSVYINKSYNSEYGVILPLFFKEKSQINKAAIEHTCGIFISEIYVYFIKTNAL